MKRTRLAFFYMLILLCGINLSAQETLSNLPSENLIRNYLSETKTYASLYSGKLQTPYELNLTNAPYLISPDYLEGDVWINHVKYSGISMRFDLYREELIILLPNNVKIVPEREKMGTIYLHEYKIIPSNNVEWKNSPEGHFLLLINDGEYPLIKKYFLTLEQKIVNRIVEYSFNYKERYYLCKEGVCYPVKNKKSILKLFSDKHEELTMYMKQNKLKFKDNREKDLITIVEYYETLKK